MGLVATTVMDCAAVDADDAYDVLEKPQVLMTERISAISLVSFLTHISYNTDLRSRLPSRLQIYSDPCS